MADSYSSANENRFAGDARCLKKKKFQNRQSNANPPSDYSNNRIISPALVDIQTWNFSIFMNV